MKKAFDIGDTWLGYELHPETPVAGMPLSQRFSLSDIAAMYKNIRKRGDELGIAFSDPVMLSNSRLALEAGEYARDMGKYAPYHEGMFYAYFTERRDIGVLDVIQDVARQCGLDPVELAQSLGERRYAARLAETRSEARKIQLTGVPTFIVNGRHKIVGAQPVEVFKDLFERIGHSR